MSEVATFSIAPLGDSALVIGVGHEISEPTRQRVLAVVHALAAARITGAAEAVAGFTTVTLHYDPLQLVPSTGPFSSPYDVICSKVSAALEGLQDADVGEGSEIEVPVCYDGEFGPDLAEVATHAGITPDEVVSLHTARRYRVHLIGFLPGFGYLGGLDPKLAMPRRTSPRTAVPEGTVGIGGMQTGVYPLESPGGWQLIGRTPLRFFNPANTPPTLLAPGDVVRFCAIDRPEYDRLLAARK